MQELNLPKLFWRQQIYNKYYLRSVVTSMFHFACPLTNMAKVVLASKQPYQTRKRQSEAHIAQMWDKY